MVTFDISLVFRTGSAESFGVDVSGFDLIIDGYAYLQRAGNRAPGPSVRFKCPPFAADKRSYEQAIAEKIGGWID